MFGKCSLNFGLKVSLTLMDWVARSTGCRFDLSSSVELKNCESMSDSVVTTIDDGRFCSCILFCKTLVSFAGVIDWPWWSSF